MFCSQSVFEVRWSPCDDQYFGGQGIGSVNLNVKESPIFKYSTRDCNFASVRRRLCFVSFSMCLYGRSVRKGTCVINYGSDEILNMFLQSGVPQFVLCQKKKKSQNITTTHPKLSNLNSDYMCWKLQKWQ